MSASLSVSVKETSYSIANNTSTVSITVKVEHHIIKKVQQNYM